MTATADGSIFTWSVREAKELSNTRQLAAKERWVSAIFAGEKLVALDRSGTLSVWSLASGATLWSRKLPHHSATIQVSPDASSILADFSSHHQNGASGTWAVYDLSSGQPLEKEDHEETRGDVILSTSLMHSTDIVSAWSFYTGNGDDLILEYPELRRAGSDCVNPGPKAREFLEFLLNGRYFLAGSAGTFQIHELCSAKALASFYFGEVSSLSPNLAQSLIERVVEIDGSSAQRVRLHLRDGPWLEANPAPGVSTRLTLATGGESIVTPRDGKFADGDLVVLSGDGKWMAVTKQKTFSVWDARTGFALSAPLSIEEKPLDIQFTADGRSIRLALPNGSVLTQTLRFRWKGKPAWLTGLSEALTGRFAEPSGAIGRVPARELPGIRARVLAQLQMFAPVDPAAAHLNRLFGWIGN
jgi:WD40 repeat protein